MAKYFLPFVCLFLSATLVAQPVFTWQNNPQPGDTFTFYMVPVQAPGPSGANVTWNFSGLVDTSHYGEAYDSCASVYNCALFPGSNSVNVIASTGNREYLILDTGAYSVNGAYAYGHDYFYTDPMDLMRYPVEYLNDFTDSFADHFSAAGFSYLERGHNRVTVDGWGTLNLPNGSFEGALRLHNRQVYTDSVLRLSGAVTRDSVDIYYWFAQGFRENLFYEYRFFQNGNYVDSSSIYSSQSPTAVPVLSTATNVFSLYPNPANSELHLKFSLVQDQHVRIGLSDMVGKEIIIFTNCAYPAGAHTVDVALPSLSPGLYMVTMRSGEALAVQTLEVQ